MKKKKEKRSNDKRRGSSCSQVKLKKRKLHDETTNKRTSLIRRTEEKKRTKGESNVLSGELKEKKKRERDGTWQETHGTTMRMIKEQSQWQKKKGVVMFRCRRSTCREKQTKEKCAVLYAVFASLSVSHFIEAFSAARRASSCSSVSP